MVNASKRCPGHIDNERCRKKSFEYGTKLPSIKTDCWSKTKNLSEGIKVISNFIQ